MGIGDRVKEARKRAGVSQAELARLVGRSQSAVAEWETGETEPRRNIVERIAQALGVSALWLEVGGAGESERLYDAPLTSDANRAGGARSGAGEFGPIFASASGGAEQVLTPQNVVEHRLKPRKWTRVKGLYGFYVATDTMAPRINPGELIWVHPHRRAAPGQEAVFARRAAGGEDLEIMVKICAGQTAAKWIVRQFNPKKEFELKKADWDCQLVVDIDLDR